MTSDPIVLPAALQTDDDQGIDLMRFARALWAGKFWIIGATVVAMMLGIIYARYFTTPVYTSAARLVLEDRQNNFAGLQGVVGSMNSDAVSMNTEFQVMRSPDLLQTVARKYKFYEDPTFSPWLRDPPFTIKGALKSLFVAPAPRSVPPLDTQIEVAANQIARSLTIASIRGTRVFRITATTTDPKSSQALVNALADEYILNQIEVKYNAVQQATEWLALRVAELEGDLKTSQERLQAFTAEKNLPTADGVQALSRQLTDIRARITNSEEAMLAAQTKASALNAAMDADDTAAALELTQDPSLQRMLQLRDQGQQMDSAIAGRIDMLRQQAEQDAMTLETQIASLKISQQALEQRVNAQADDLAVAEQLKQQVEANRTIYEYFLNRLKETSVQRGVQQADARILSRGHLPGNPSAPNKNSMVMMATVIGLLLSVGALVGIEALNRGYVTSDALEADTGLTVLGQIPRIDGGTRLDILKYLAENPNSAAAEAYRNLRTSILLSNLDNPPQVIMSTSSLPAEGKTVQAFALAMNLAAMGRKVLLIEGDVRRSIFTARLGYEKGPGLIGVLAKQVTLQDALVKQDDQQFDILLGGQAQTNPVDVFSSHAFSDLIAELREQYDTIVIDSPPLLAVPDARVIGQHVDAIVYSVRWNLTTRAQVREGLALLKTVNLKAAGLVLAQVNLKTMRNYGYGAYGNYGGKYYSMGE